MICTIITVVFNSVNTIEQTILSVAGQSERNNIEHIIVDGNSTDGTLDIIGKHKEKLSQVVSEPDNGIYDAMNKGIALAKGDIIGFLNADDCYANNAIIEKILNVFRSSGVDSCYGDLIYIDRRNPQRIVRRWKSASYRKGKCKSGWMPPHPTFFVKRSVYRNFGDFNTNLQFAADYEIMLRFLEKHSVSTHYIPEVLIKMRVGGITNRNIKIVVKSYYEVYKAWRLNDLNFSALTLLRKPISKISQFC